MGLDRLQTVSCRQDGEASGMTIHWNSSKGQLWESTAVPEFVPKRTVSVAFIVRPLEQYTDPSYTNPFASDNRCRW